MFEDLSRHEVVFVLTLGNHTIIIIIIIIIILSACGVQVTYVSVQFCSPGRPDHSVALFKSVDYGLTWLPFQFFSDQCRRVFGRQFAQRVNRSNEQEPLCTDFGEIEKEHGNRINPLG